MERVLVTGMRLRLIDSSRTCVSIGLAEIVSDADCSFGAGNSSEGAGVGATQTPSTSSSASTNGTQRRPVEEAQEGD